MKTRLQKSIEYIATFCEKRKCDVCQFRTPEKRCNLMEHPPCGWIEFFEKEKNEERI